MDKTKELLHEYFKTKTEKDISDGDNLFSSGLLDSMGVIELISYLEMNTGIEIDPEDISEDNFKSIDAIAALIARIKK